MRPGEIFAGPIGKVHSNSDVVDQRLYSSTNVDTPKRRRGKDTSRTVPLSSGSVTDLNLWKAYARDSRDSAYLFCSEAGTTPLRSDNHWKRNIALGSSKSSSAR